MYYPSMRPRPQQQPVWIVNAPKLPPNPASARVSGYIFKNDLVDDLTHPAYEEVESLQIAVFLRFYCNPIRSSEQIFLVLKQRYREGSDKSLQNLVHNQRQIHLEYEIL